MLEYQADPLSSGASTVHRGLGLAGTAWLCSPLLPVAFSSSFSYFLSPARFCSRMIRILFCSNSLAKCLPPTFYLFRIPSGSLSLEYSPGLCIQMGGLEVVMDQSWEPTQESVLEGLYLFPNPPAESLIYPPFSGYLSDYLILLLVLPLQLDCLHWRFNGLPVSKNTPTSCRLS